jgi:hypothetical protein
LAILDQHVHPVEQDNDWQQVAEMPKVLRSQMEEIQELLDKLPRPKHQVPTSPRLQIECIEGRVCKEHREEALPELDTNPDRGTGTLSIEHAGMCIVNCVHPMTRMLLL